MALLELSFFFALSMYRASERDSGAAANNEQMFLTCSKGAVWICQQMLQAYFRSQRS